MSDTFQRLVALRRQLQGSLEHMQAQTLGFTSDHQVGYHEGQISELEFVIEQLNEIIEKDPVTLQQKLDQAISTLKLHRNNIVTTSSKDINAAKKILNQLAPSAQWVQNDFGGWYIVNADLKIE